MAAGFVLLINALQNNDERQQLRINVRQLRDASDPLTLPENIFRGVFRISRQMAADLIAEIGQYFRQIDRPNVAIPIQLKVLVALQFFGQGSYQKAVGQDYNFPMSQSSVSRCINEVAEIISNNMQNVVHFPQNERERAIEKQKFMEMGGFPGTIGALDCTHVAIIAPPTNDPQFPGILFYNRKGYYSLNVQIICSADLKILSINARYPGSVHDSAIWLTSQIKAFLTNNFQNGDESSWLIGDSGYPLEPWLMTPIPAAILDQHRRFNAVHKSTRNVIERLNGVFKSKFRCLLKHRVLHYNPITCAKIINSCAILYNLYRQRGEIDDHDVIIEENRNDPPNGVNIYNNINNNLYQRGQIIRNRIIRNHFE